MAGYTQIVGFALVLALAPPASGQDTLKQIEQQGIARTGEGQKAQQKIDTLHADTRTMIDDYYARLKLVEGLRLYNSMLQRQLDNQVAEIDILQNSIGNVATVERQVLPLMSRMIDGLEQFIALDVPFLTQEREKRTTKLRELLPRSDVTVAEKTRRVLEAYQIENDYGRTIEAYKDKLALDNASFDAEFLRIGRIGLMYRTVGNGDVGYWDKDRKGWVPLDAVPYRRYIEQGLKVAKQEIAPELISIPLNPRQGVAK
jgi:hypothetical protein